MLATAIVSLCSIFLLDRREKSLRLRYDRDVAGISKIFQYLGYGGAIHSYKNYILRGKDRDFLKARLDFKAGAAIVENLKKNPDFKVQDSVALERILRVIEEYRRNLSLIQADIKDGVSLGVTLDEKYKIDDEAALEGIALILEASEREKQAFQKSLALQKVLVYFILLVFFLVNFWTYRREISTLNAVNISLASANEELLQFAYRTSHDLKAPLVTIRDLTVFILEDIADGAIEEASSNVKKIRDQADKLRRLVVDLLNVARLDSTEDSECKAIDFQELIAEVKSLYSHLSEEKKVVVQSEILVTREHHFHKAHVFHILSNLVVNGILYSKPEVSDAFVSIRILETDTELLIEVEDNGSGIQTEKKEEVFEMFKRLQTTKGSGSGLGLYLVKKSTEKMSGHIDYESSQAGTKFKIRLPSKRG